MLHFSQRLENKKVLNAWNEPNERPPRRTEDDIDFIMVNNCPVPLPRKVVRVIGIIFLILFVLGAVAICIFFIVSCTHRQPVNSVGNFIITVEEDSPTHSHTIKGRVKNNTDKELADVIINVEYSVVLNQEGHFLSAKQTGVTIAPNGEYEFIYSGETEYEGVMKIRIVMVTVGEETYVVQS